MKLFCFIFFLSFSLAFISPLKAESVEADLNNNGVADLKGFFNSDSLSKTELDRNEDGRTDVWMYFLEGGDPWDTRADYDENYNGIVDEVFFIRGGEPVRSLADRDGDGLLEEEVTYSSGAPSLRRELKPPVDAKELEYSPRPKKTR
jgi:hypothetical protein